MRTEADLIAEVNRSGFPLQLGVERLVLETADVAAIWDVRYVEHHWQHPSTNREGFIDLVLTQRQGVGELVIECKRFQDADWTFLQKKARRSVDRAKGLVSINRPTRRTVGWHDLNVTLDSPESEFCVVVGQDRDARPMLERLSATAIESVEALAAEDVQHQFQFPEVSSSSLRVYFAVILTTARLNLCEYDPASLDTLRGTLNGSVTELPFVRFRKQLSAGDSSDMPTRQMGVKHYMVSQAKERTVFVVNTAHALKFLRYLQVDDGRLQDIHDRAQRIAR
ncbi:MAG: hypothetical protein U1F41_06890 [Burkholderiales bacterium]